MSDACATCNGRCCYDVVVRVTGLDAWRIRTRQGLEYAQFIDVRPEEEPTQESFQIGNRHCSMFLGKSAIQPRACTFLMHLPGEIRRCGIYAERPRVCSVYPMTLRFGALDLRDDVQCEPTNWNLATLDYPGWRDALLEYTLERFLFARMVALWNEFSPSEDDRTQMRFFCYLDAAVPAIEGERERMGPEAYGQMVTRWQDVSPHEDEVGRFRSFMERVEASSVGALEGSSPSP